MNPWIWRFSTQSGFMCGRVLAGYFGLLHGALMLSAQDVWETLPDVPFNYGVSAGGGVTTDGQYVYVADFSGDGNAEFVDLNDDGTNAPSERLDALGIPNGSVRLARFDPATSDWAALPTLHPVGVGGDAFSAGNLNGGLFFAAGSLYYYQFRAGPNRCALYRYELALGLTGTWSEVWDRTTAQALIDFNAGLVGLDAAEGPVILHHTGGGSYNFARSTGLTNGAFTHVVLTPSWPFVNSHFPRNGAWTYDSTKDRLFHLSGNQLLQWEASGVYAPATLLNAVPNGPDPLAVFSTRIASLKDTLGWNPGGAQTHPGVSLWGNSLVVVNNPTGYSGGPGGEDTGANVLYLVRGETTVDAWPFNEGRGLINNGDFARFFPATGVAQPLPSAPFPVGKGSGSVYLNGFIYLTQGETRTSTDDPGNVTPMRADGIRRPGKGFARFKLRTETFTGSPIIPTAAYVAAGFATLTTPTDTGTGTAPLFDGQWDSAFQAATANPAEVVIAFNGATTVGAARARFGNTDHEWSLHAADTLNDLSSEAGSFVHVFGPVPVSNGEVGWREWNATPVTRRYFRFRVARVSGSPVEIRELELQRPKAIQTVLVGGTNVQVNYLEVTPPNPVVLVGEAFALRAEASLSLGPEHYDVSTQASWSSSNESVATVDGKGLVSALAAGEVRVAASLEGLSNSVSLQVVKIGPRDDDVSVAWIQRLPSLSFVWDSTNATRDGWPKEGSNITWRALVKNWHPFARTNVGYRWLLDGVVAATGMVDLSPRAWTAVDFVRPWSFTREQLRFEIDPENALPELSEANNAVATWTDAITAGLWVEQSLYDYFHEHQYKLGDGANGWEDWAQRQVARWNQLFAVAVHPIDAPRGVLDRIRLDKITIVPDGALPLAGGLPGNNPDSNDRTVDLVWGFPVTLLNGSFYSNHTATNDTNPFYFETSLIHELGHARYLIDGYGFNVWERADQRRVHVQQNGQDIAGTPYLPRSYPFWDHVHIIRPGVGNPFEGIMGSGALTTQWDRYSVAALNLIAGRRAVRGNANAPNNIGVFRNDLPASNQVQLLDAHGLPLAGANVHVYRASGIAEWYGKQFDNTPDLTFTADELGRINVGRNPFSDEPLVHSFGISTMVALLKAEAGARTGFAFLKAGLFNMEYWRGNTNQGRYLLTLPMISSSREVAAVNSWPEATGWRVQIIMSGDSQPQTVTVGGAAAFYQEGSWWVFSPGAAGERLVVATWPGSPVVQDWFSVPPAVFTPSLSLQLNTGDSDLLQIIWPTLNGYAFDLETSLDLRNWTLLPGGRAFGTGEFLMRQEAMTGTWAFYRVIMRRLAD